MGLYVSHIRSLPLDQQRNLYVYLLDYGWPDDVYEKLFRDHFQAMARRASETGAIVLASHRGVHFANEVLSFHRVAEFNGDDVLPAILITKTHPRYFVESYDAGVADGERALDEVVLVPLRKACKSPEYFSQVMESIFRDLEKGLDLKDFRVATYDPEKVDVSVARKAGRKLWDSVLLEPNFGGVGVDLKKLFR